MGALKRGLDSSWGGRTPQTPPLFSRLGLCPILWDTPANKELQVYKH